MQRTEHQGSTQRREQGDEFVIASESPIACSLSDAGLATRLESLRRDLFAGAEERQELERGYAFRFPGDGGWEAKIADFVASERRCCTFFHFELSFEPDPGPIWLKLTGASGVKEFIEAMFDAEQRR